jgi:drug/metabolite transporter (DMT)-like permease
MSPTSNKTASPLLIIIAFAIVYLVWGSTYFFIRIAEQGGMPPFLMGALRFTTAGLLLMFWCGIRKEKIFVLKDIASAAVTGIMLLFVGIGIVIMSERTLPSGMVAILVSSAPIWFVVLDKRNWGINFNNKATIIGLIIGFGGVMLLFSEQIRHVFSGRGGSSILIWMVLLLLGSISWSAGSLYSKHKPTSVSGSVSTAWQMIAGGIIYIPAALLHGEFSHLDFQTIHPVAWLAVLYLIVFGSIAAYSAYVWLLQVRSATQVSTYAYVNPVIAVILGIIFAGEHISLAQIAGLVVILTSVLLINLAKYRSKIVRIEKVALVEND